MPSAAPRYDARIFDAVRRLDDIHVPIAETCRRVGEYAESVDLSRPSYVHVRRIVKAERERAREVTALTSSLVGETLAGRKPQVVRALDRRREADARARLRRTS